MDLIIGYYESKNMPCFHTEYTLMGIQENVIVPTTIKYGTNMLWIIFVLPRMSQQIISMCLHSVFHVVKSVGHSPLECGTIIFKAKGKFRYQKLPQGQMKVVLC